ncbi:MAG: recombinase family protein [Pseudobdellovibrionaceae bacterium]
MNKIVALYLRVSTQDQNVESQQRALLDWCNKQGIFNHEQFIDHGISGAKESRPALNQLMTRVEQGDIEQVIVFSFSRFARSVSHLLKALQKFKDKGVRFHSVTEALDTNSPMGMALFTILGALAQLERELIRERVIAGLKNARAKGKKIGRVRKRNDVLIQSLLAAGLSFREVAKIAKCSHGSVSASKKEMLDRQALEKNQSQEPSENKSTPPVLSPIEESHSRLDSTLKKLKDANISDEVVRQVQADFEHEAKEKARAILNEINQTIP